METKSVLEIIKMIDRRIVELYDEWLNGKLCDADFYCRHSELDKLIYRLQLNAKDNQ